MTKPAPTSVPGFAQLPEGAVVQKIVEAGGALVVRTNLGLFIVHADGTVVKA